MKNGVDTLRVLGVIPARGGSKGIPNKNLLPLNGKPVIAYTIDAALGAKYLSAVVVSSESERILDIAGRSGKVGALLRPASMAGDASPTIDAVLHALEHYENAMGAPFTHVLVLQPTTPFRLSSDIDAAVELMASRPDVKSLIACCDATHVHPSVMYRFENGLALKYLGPLPNKRRQEFDRVYLRNGAIYIAERNFAVSERKLMCDVPLLYEMPRSRSINLDEPFDLHLAELLMTHPFLNDVPS